MFYKSQEKGEQENKGKGVQQGVCLLDDIVETRFRNEYWNVTCNMAYCCIDNIDTGYLFVSCFLTYSCHIGNVSWLL